MPGKDLNIGMVGYGFMGRCHSNAFRTAPNFFDLPRRPVLKAACGRDRERTQAFADTWGYESVETDWRKVIERPDIDLVDICAPNDLHREIAVAAAEAGKMVITEKPIARTTAEGEAMVAAVEKAGVPNLVCYNYRRIPAVSFIKQIVESGKLGRIYHYRAMFLQDWTISPDVPQGGQGTWRLDVEAAGSGVTGDLLAHCIDTAMWINGPIASLTAMTETFVKQRRHAETGQVQPVGIDDAAAVLARYANGSMGTFEFDALRPRPQGALHPRDQRRARFLRLGPPRPQPGRLVRPPRRGPIPRLELDPRHRRRAPLPRPLVGARPDHRLRALVRAHDGRLHRLARRRPSRRPDVPRRARHDSGLRRHHRLGPVASMAEPLTQLTSSASPRIRAAEVHGPRMRPCPRARHLPTG